jgi:predicted dehydrogenase
MRYDVAVVGTGPDPDDPDTDGFAMAYRHADAYDRLETCEVVACADIVRENAEAFADRRSLPRANAYEDVDRMLREVRPDVVSVCVPPAFHADIVIRCAESGAVDAVHCEKPMAKTWAECRRMVEVCDAEGVQLTFNHQRRFGGPFRRAKELLDEGAIGSLRRIELGGKNLYDYGSHYFDLCGFFTEQSDPEWVVCGIDYAEENVQFGVHNENNAVAQWRYENGVFGLASTGDASILPCEMRLVGTGGTIDVGVDGGPTLRMFTESSGGWKAVDAGGDTVHAPTWSKPRMAALRVAETVPFLPEAWFRKSTFVDRAIEDVVDALATGRTPELAAENVAQSTELVFGCWEAARRRTRVEFPLDVDDNPLERMVDEGRVLGDERPAAEPTR